MVSEGIKSLLWKFIEHPMFRSMFFINSNNIYVKIMKNYLFTPYGHFKMNLLEYWNLLNDCLFLLFFSLLVTPLISWVFRSYYVWFYYSFQSGCKPDGVIVTVTFKLLITSTEKKKVNTTPQDNCKLQLPRSYVLQDVTWPIKRHCFFPDWVLRFSER